MERGEKETVFCIDDADYDKLVAKVNKQGAEITRKKRNKGLGETGKEAMKYAVDHCMTTITIGNKKTAKTTQDLWFHKDYAEKRREAISEYSMSVIQD